MLFPRPSAVILSFYRARRETFAASRRGTRCLDFHPLDASTVPVPSQCHNQNKTGNVTSASIVDIEQRFHILLTVRPDVLADQFGLFERISTALSSFLRKQESRDQGLQHLPRTPAFEAVRKLIDAAKEELQRGCACFETAAPLPPQHEVIL